ncbi:solute carrier family 22 member 14 [Rhinolophus ferrumequinum]|uniref:Solute carrier family 22 member 14 n=1 Tax=Rhinolophus ferrumequinum TaxID=59479 RepID=A0A7J7UL21_RHIFE|nr:solute carrier family 22 member 14 [Rhinolophus ferrumequinum]
MLTSEVWEVVSVQTELNPFFEQMTLLHMLKAMETKQDENFTNILNVVGSLAHSSGGWWPSPSSSTSCWPSSCLLTPSCSQPRSPVVTPAGY